MSCPKKWLLLVCQPTGRECEERHDRQTQRQTEWNEIHADTNKQSKVKTEWTSIVFISWRFHKIDIL